MNANNGSNLQLNRKSEALSFYRAIYSYTDVENEFVDTVRYLQLETGCLNQFSQHANLAFAQKS